MEVYLKGDDTMWQFISALATLFGGLAAATTFHENIQRAATRRAERRALRHGMVLPEQAAASLERLLGKGAKVVVGKDLQGYKLVVIRARPQKLPDVFGGYRVGRRPQLA